MNTILHSDLNSFFASVECFYHPELRSKAVSVCGSVEDRHGIVLASNQNAKQYGVQTGEPVWQAKQKCPFLVVVKPNYDLYVRHSKAARKIYMDYTSNVEPFGIDESWLDVTGSEHLFGSGEELAHTIRRRVKYELGITVSIGVSFTKTFAKLGSDLKKPNAVTVISKDNYKTVVWNLPVSKLLYVGRATTKALGKYGIETIGQLACANAEWLYSVFGKRGYSLWRAANGLDGSVVKNSETESVIKSIGNSTTTPKDMVTFDDIYITITKLAESTAERMRKKHVKANTIQVSLRYINLEFIERQITLPFACTTARTIKRTAMELIKKHWDGGPLRSIGVRACGLSMNEFPQLSFLPEKMKEQKQEAMEATIQNIRKRYGHFSIQFAAMALDKELSNIDTQDETSKQSVAFMR